MQPEAIHNHASGDQHNHERPSFNIDCQDCGKMCLYADDSTYTHSDSDPNILKEIIDARYQNIIDYMAKNKLVLNTEKTYLLTSWG